MIARSIPTPSPSRLEAPADLNTVMALERGAGLGQGRDGIMLNQVVASYTHLHALAAPDWAAGMVKAAVAWRSESRKGCARCG